MVWRGLLVPAVANVRVVGELLLGHSRSMPLPFCMFWAFNSSKRGFADDFASGGVSAAQGPESNGTGIANA